MAWFKAAAVSDLESKTVIGIQIGGHEIAIYSLDGAYYATDDICTHQRAYLSEGYLDGACIECPLHQALFDIRTGAVVDGPTETPLKTYPVKVEDQAILIDLPES